LIITIDDRFRPFQPAVNIKGAGAVCVRRTRMTTMWPTRRDTKSVSENV